MGRIFYSVATLLLLMLAASVFAQKQRQLYRYVDNNGVKVIDFQVPPDVVARGYEVLNERGRVLEIVPPQLSDSERADGRREEEQAEELREWDERLLLRYSSIADIEAARDRALGDLRVRVSILRGKQRSLSGQIESYQAQAADQERLGREVDSKLLQAIDDLRTELATTDRAIADRELELASVEDSYNRDIERFASLLEVVEMRRRIGSRP